MTISRRHFLIAAAASGAVTTIPLATAHADDPIAVDRTTVFADAAARYGVPVSVLVAFSWAQTRWDDHQGRPSTSHGYGPMHLVDGAAAEALATERAGKPVTTIDTLGDAARVSGLDAAELRSSAAANIAGAAALLAHTQKSAGLATATDPAAWYQSVADCSGLAGPAAQVAFADQVMASAATGVQRTLPGGISAASSSVRVGDHRAQRERVHQRGRLTPADYPLDAPKGLDVSWVPAPYVQTGTGAGDYGNWDRKPSPDSPALRYLVIHDTECSFDVALKLVQDPTYLGWHYTVRSADGHIAEHLRGDEAVGWHAGNWYVNQHSIGVEHEGYMAQGSTWYSEPMYAASAKLVGYLCREHGIPLDRAHVIGHDNVPGVTTANIKGMHVDPGPYWNWEHYFELLGAPLDRHTTVGPRKDGACFEAVRILPGFDDNQPLVTGCTTAGVPCPQAPTNFLYVYTQPDENAPLVSDLGRYPNGQPCTNDASDTGARASAGQDYVAVERRGDWLAIWYLGQKGWILDPRATPRTRVLQRARIVKAAPGVTVNTYGRAYPEASAYPAGTTPQAISPLVYTFGGEQAYVVTDSDVVADYYKAKTYSMDTPGDHIDIVGKTEYLQLSFGSRIAWVMADQVVDAGR